jgi:hypothetical protein
MDSARSRRQLRYCPHEEVASVLGSISIDRRSTDSRGVHPANHEDMPIPMLVSDFSPLLAWDDSLVVPESVSMTPGLSRSHIKRMLRTAQLLYTFWDSGDLTRLDPPGLAEKHAAVGAYQTLGAVRAMVPDLGCTIQHLSVYANGFGARLKFFGHVYSGDTGHPDPPGRPLEFIAYDLQLALPGPPNLSVA